ncbi:serum response factor-binding protein 1 isoform X2 [Perognathus longimembris pacificus]|nr:serum response factor-binding protein 1 isoform X2 [Perognathus longimembris pacificus]
MKELKPDEVTKSALGDDISFEKICKKPDSTATERAIARLATYPLFKKKIDELKAAVQSFKDARQNATDVQPLNTTSEDNHSKNTLCASEERKLQQHERTVVGDQKGKEAKITAKKPASDSKARVAKTQPGPKAVDISDSPSQPSGKGSPGPAASQKPPAEPRLKPERGNSKKEVAEPSLDGSSESEGESEEEEKEYFDDSTEERFYKQSSASEESDSGDDFFIGKVRLTRKKESGACSSAKGQRPPQKVEEPTQVKRVGHWNAGGNQKPTAEARKFESVFFHSLSGSKSSGRDYRERAPKSKVSDFPENKAQVKNQFNKNAPRRAGPSTSQSHLPLHPSWEASRRRKEQQSNIAVFQGKKITFDD